MAVVVMPVMVVMIIVTIMTAMMGNGDVDGSYDDGSGDHDCDDATVN